ncbi:UDP-N-acetylglucosamine 2-epimerase [Gammaproteobacteria bacterium]|nr:UDP-N-acetylglucosamine 2-epimerase [Gammaproteobacteria bacterium]
MILFIIGTRPQYVKMFPLYKHFKDNLDFMLIDSGQHYDPQMSKQFAKDFNMHPDFIFNKSKLSGIEFFGNFVIELENFILKNKSISKVVVFGDTITTAAGSIVSKIMGLELIHIEAGLRSFNRKMPEEINRIISDHIADKNLILSRAGKENLLNEGIDIKKIIEIGDLMYDSAMLAKKMISSNQLFPDNTSLLTIHRKENITDKKSLIDIFNFISNLNYKFILPMHHSLKNALKKFELSIPNNIEIIKPLSYFDTINRIMNSEIILTDSGGLQKEAYYFHKPVIVLRTESEWVELIQENYSIYYDSYEDNHVFNTNYDNIIYAKKDNLEIIKESLTS